jgi:hypothetical protein
MAATVRAAVSHHSRPRDARPHARILHGDTCHVDPVVHLPPLDLRTQSVRMARQALSQVFREGPQVGFTMASRVIIDGESDHRTPRASTRRASFSHASHALGA